MPIIFTIPVLLGFVIWSFINPTSASWWYVGIFCGGFLGIRILSWVLYRNRNIGGNLALDLSEEERHVLRKYFLHCQFSQSSINNASTLAGMSMCAIVLCPWFWYKGEITQSTIVGLSFLICSPLSIWYNPTNRLNNIYQKTGDFVTKMELDAIQSVKAKIG